MAPRRSRCLDDQLVYFLHYPLCIDTLRVHPVLESAQAPLVAAVVLLYRFVGHKFIAGFVDGVVRQMGKFVLPVRALA